MLSASVRSWLCFENFVSSMLMDVLTPALRCVALLASG